MLKIPDFLTHPDAMCGTCAYGYIPPALETSDRVRCVRDPVRSRSASIAAVGSDYPLVEAITRACGEYVNIQRKVK